MQLPESTDKAPEYNDATDLPYYASIVQLERHLHTIELSYATEKLAVDLKDEDNEGGGGGDDDNQVNTTRITRLQSVTRGAYNLFQTNVGLLLLLLVYSLLGAAVFAAIEGTDLGEKHGSLRDEVRLRLIRNILNATLRSQNHPVSGLGNRSGDIIISSDGNNPSHSSFDEYDFVEELLVSYEEFLLNDSTAGSMAIGSAERMIPWTYWGALYFCATVFTTVGYGNIYPKTGVGMVVTMIYAAVGIPLCLVVLSKLGKSLTHCIKFLWSYIRRFYYTGSFQRVRRMIPVSRIRRSFLQRLGDHIRLRRRGTLRLRTASVPMLRGDGDNPGDRSRGEGDPGGGAFVPYEVNDTFNLPPIVALVVAFLYIVFGAFLYSSWENWSYLEAFYFTFISLCAIGFGDIVPDHPKFFLASSVYLLFGLALVAMVINVIMEAINKATERVINVGERFIQHAPRQCLTAVEAADMNGYGVRRNSV